MGITFTSSNGSVRLDGTIEGGDSTDVLVAAAQAAGWLDRLIARLVAGALDAGLSWRQIARCLDISPQTAITRYRARGPDGEIQPRLFD